MISSFQTMVEALQVIPVEFFHLVSGVMFLVVRYSFSADDMAVLLQSITANDV
jgi:hypothetical protein